MSDNMVPLESLVAHRTPMLLLDRIVSVSDNHVVAEAAVRADNPFFESGRGIPAYTGLEMMAQAIAAIDGMKNNEDGLTPKVGFLLGCRNYAVTCTDFQEGETLRITADMVFGDNQMFVFDCHIADAEGGELASANLSVYAPADPEKFLMTGDVA